ncbi:MAG: YraN family protein, partial [Nanoarchaeota archaeon]|nr:YraN family protein [Nanoarchaeota archaeon]
MSTLLKLVTITIPPPIRNFKKRYGEIDIIAQSGSTLVFIEVKTRWSRKFGLPEEAVTPWKLKSV